MRWWWASVALAAACGDVVIVDDGSGGSGGGATQGVQSSSTGTATVCEVQGEAECISGTSCTALYDWGALVEDPPPPPADSPSEGTPCCPECREAPCAGCHTKAFKRCIPRAQCDDPQPPDNCGYPEICP